MDEELVIGGAEGSYIQLIEAVAGSDGVATGKEWKVMLIEKGLSKNKYNYSTKVLQEAAPLFNGVYSFSDHTNEAEQKVRPERSVKDKVGRFSDVTYGEATINGKLVEGLQGTFKVVAPWLRDLLRESVQMGESDFVGFSIDALGSSVPSTIGGKQVKEVTGIKKVYSVDVVTNPSAGGRLMRLVASTSERRTELDPEETSGASTGAVAVVATPAVVQAPGLSSEQLAQIVREQTQAVLQEATGPLAAQIVAQQGLIAQLQESQRITSQRDKFDAAVNGATGLSAMGQARLRTTFAGLAATRDLTDEEVTEAIRESVSYEASLIQESMPGPRSTPRIYLGSNEGDKHYQALVGWFENEDQILNGNAIPRYRTLKEAYCRFSGRDSFDVDPMEIQAAFSTNYDSARDHKRITESVQTSTWGQVYADVLYLMLIKAYRANPAYNRWRQVVSDVESVPDFQTRHWTRLGGYSDLVGVVETGTYQPMVSSTNEEVSYAVTKRGGLDDVTFEAIANDRVGAIRRIPTSMARAASRTLYKFVMNLVTSTNPTMSYDTVALYDAAHANTNTVALSLTGLQNALLAMRTQTAFSESLEILGERNLPKTLIVGPTLELLAQRLVNPSDAYLAAIASPSGDVALDPQAFKGRLQVLVYDVLTSTTAWYAIADPAEVATFVIGFLNGREDPELFVQDMPNVGSNFTADKTTYKIRHIYGGVVEDHRSFYRGNT